MSAIGVVHRRPWCGAVGLAALLLVAPPMFAEAPSPVAGKTAAIDLVRGLNLIGMPLQPATTRPYDASDLARDTGATFVARFVAGPGGLGHAELYLPGVGTPFVIEGNRGYFVQRPGAAMVLQVSGSDWPAATARVDFNVGLNAMALPHEVPAGWTASTLATVTGAAKVSRVVPDPTRGGRLQSWFPGLALPDFALESGKGYLVSVPAARVVTLPVPDFLGLTFLATNAQGYREFRNDKDDSVLIEVPAGTFAMGTTTAEANWVNSTFGWYPSHERPQHQVTLSRYYIGKYEVTNAQYRAFLAATGDPAGPTQHAGHHPDEPGGWDHTPSGGSSVAWTPYSTTDDSPVVGVSWYDAYAYCAWAGLALPTEAQWECAARGRDGRRYPWGEEAPDAGGVHRANWNPAGDGFGYCAPVGSYGAEATPPRADGTSPFGALDLAGNVWEWCGDWYGRSYWSQSVWTDPLGPSTGESRLVRGGSWSILPDRLRAAFRDAGGNPGNRPGSNVGFRVSR